MADVNIPGVGRVPSKYVLLGGGVVVLIVGVAYLRHRNTAAPTDSSTSDTAAGPASTYQPDASYDPTGYGYSLPYYPYDSSSSSSSSSTTYTTNNEWAAAAEDALTTQGITTATSAAAIGKVLAGLTVTTDQKTIFLQAVGLLGDPPGSYPKPIMVSDPTSPSSGSSSSSSTAVPGWAYNLKVTSYTSTSAHFTWTAASNAKAYNIYLNGTKVHSTADTNYTLSGFKHDTLYTIGIQPYNSNGDGPISHVQVHTKK